MSDQSQAQTQTSAPTATGVFALLKAKPGVTRERVMAIMPRRDTRDGPTLSRWEDPRMVLARRRQGRGFPSEHSRRRGGEIDHGDFAAR
jgi:hypothetical protein